MSILSKQPDGLGYHYGFIPGDSRQINVRIETLPDAEAMKGGGWFACVGGEKLPGVHFTSLKAAEDAAIEWAKANPIDLEN